MIPLKTKGRPFNLNDLLVGRVQRDPLLLDDNTFLIDEIGSNLIEIPTLLGVLSTLKNEEDLLSGVPSIYNIHDLSHLDNGDIVSVNPAGWIRTLFRSQSHNNSLFVTERCNSNCLMCSQPPKSRDDILELFELNRKLIKLIPKDTVELGITGGEPTLMGDLFPELLATLKEELPNTRIHVLTNGRAFAWNDVVKKIANVDHPNLVLGIPLYADYYKHHDYIVQAKNAFNQTILGLHNLARYGLRVEIRVVLHKLSIPRLVPLSKFIFKNLPFVEHIALMGLEYTGYTPYNIDKLWIDPWDYREELSEAVKILDCQGLAVSIYNHQLCVVPEYLWEYCRKSVSAWKNDYLEVCDSCAKKEDCGGFFTSSLKKHSNYIKALD
jgi:His-Xaa-Ser system radical SAM maturase HxsC